MLAITRTDDGNVQRLLARPSRREATDRRTVYLAHAYACHDMALRACDTEDEKTLRAMTIVWQILASRCSPRAGYQANRAEPARSD